MTHEFESWEGEVGDPSTCEACREAPEHWSHDVHSPLPDWELALLHASVSAPPEASSGGD